MLKIGLVGVGYLGSRHLKHLCELKGVEVAGIWDTNPVVVANTAKQFGVLAASGLDELLAECRAVVLAAPTSQHYKIGCQVIDAGRALFVEKPICATADEGRRLVDMASQSNVILQVGHIERFNRAWRALQGLTIRPRFIEVHRLAEWNPRGIDVAVVHDLMIHDLDLVLNLIQAYPSQIHASGVSVITPTVDIAAARLEFPQGQVANLTASRISLKKMRKLRMFGENEYIALDLGKGICEFIGVDDGTKDLSAGTATLGEMRLGKLNRRVYRKMLEADEGDAMRLELTAFRNAILHGEPPAVSGEDGLRALELAEQIVDSIAKSSAPQHGSNMLPAAEV